MFTWLKRKNNKPAFTTTSQSRKGLELKGCGKCPRNCKLSEPKCGRGKRQAEMMIRQGILKCQ